MDFYEFSAGCHILVTIPPSLLRALDGEITNFHRCSHLIFDDADDTFAAHSADVKRIVDLYRDSHAQSAAEADEGEASSRLSQVVVAANFWTPAVKQFVGAYMMVGNDVQGPTIAIANLLEAALYGRVRHDAVVVEDKPERKLQKLL